MNLKPQVQLPKHGDKILFGLAIAYFLLVLSWLIQQNQLKIPFIKTNQPEKSVNSLSPSDKAFIAYLQVRLATIDLSPPSAPTAENSPQTANIPNIKTNLPSVNVSPPPSPPKPTPPSIIERVYIPLYPETPPVPQATVPTSPPAPSTSKVESVPILDPINNPPPTTALLTPPSYLLVGTLAAGDRSYAIFQIDGKPRQVRIGEVIDQNGWVLVKVENQQITLRRQGKQRIINVGDEL